MQDLKDFNYWFTKAGIYLGVGFICGVSLVITFSNSVGIGDVVVGNWFSANLISLIIQLAQIMLILLGIEFLFTWLSSKRKEQAVPSLDDTQPLNELE